MAWCQILAHPRVGELTSRDFERLKEELSGKARCYGYVYFSFCEVFFCFVGWMKREGGETWALRLCAWLMNATVRSFGAVLEDFEVRDILAEVLRGRG